MSREVDRRPAFGVRRSDIPDHGRSAPGDRDERVLAAFDRDLAAALSISPSSDFEARVRQRVDEDQAPQRWPYTWLAAAAALVLVAGLFYAMNRTPASDSVPPPQIADRRPDVVLPPAPPREIESPRVVAIARATRETAPGPQPEVIVPLNQMEAVRRLVRAVNEGRVVGAIPAPQEGPVAPPAELAVAPLVVEPIPVPALEPGAEAPAPEIRRSY
jgi:hypothetical protein